MDLEDAAAAALTKVKELEAEVDPTLQSLTEAEEHLSRVDGQIETDWVPVQNDGQELLRRIEEEQSRLAEDASEAIGALDTLVQAVRTAKADSEEKLSDASEELDALQQRVKAIGSGLATLFEEAEAAAAELESLASARQQQLEGVLARMDELLDDRIVPYLEDVQQELVEWKDNLEGYVAELWNPLFESMAETWEASLHGAVAAVVAAGVDKAAERAQTMVAAHVEECHTRYGDTLEQIGTLHERLITALQKLEASVEDGAGEIAGQGTKGAEELEQTNAGLESLHRALEAVRDRLASFSFVRM